jgi:hypothetical protein
MLISTALLLDSNIRNSVCNIERGVKEWLEREIGVKVNVKEAFKINNDAGENWKVGSRRRTLC